MTVIGQSVSGDRVTFTVNVAHLGSEFTLGGTTHPLAVRLESLTASARWGRVKMHWETASEVDLLGFNLYRAAADGAWVQLNAAMLPSQAPGSPSGASYAYDDLSATRGGVYRYRLAAVGLTGQETPLDTVEVAVPYWLWLPIMVQ